MYTELVRSHPRFIYKSYSTKKTTRGIVFTYAFIIEPDIVFAPKVFIPTKQKRIDKATLDNIAFHIGLLEIPSYWKVACSPEIVVKAGALKAEQIKFLRQLLIKGLGEFFYVNKIDFTKPGFLKIKSDKDAPWHKVVNGKISDRNLVLIPVGGGKDSIVTLEILTRAGLEVGVMHLQTVTNFRTSPLKLPKSASYGKEIVVKRYIDKKLLDLNKLGYLNGHVPFSAYLAFVSMATAILNGYRYVVVSNEQSANQGNVKYKGESINHQWSKSYEFESSFRNYSKRFLIKSVEYFSFLRPLNELQVGKLFVRHPEHFDTFRSCNVRSRSTSSKWCNMCAKCLFTYTMLYPFLDDVGLKKIFGEDLLNKKSLLRTMEALLGQDAAKPFDCVGTEKEVATALKMGTAKRGRRPYLVQKVWSKLKYSPHIMEQMNTEHFLPNSFKKILVENLRKESILS